jgi:hypothetical protein
LAAPERLDPSVFGLPVERLRDGYYSDQYFNLTKELLEHEGRRAHVRMQVFQRRESILGGIDEAIAILRLCSGHRAEDGAWIDGWDRLEVHALHEGDEIAPYEVVMTIEGDYALFAHLETVYLGGMARRSLVMRNVKGVVEAARGKPILFFPARHDHWLVQTGDGWSAHVAGAIGVSTDAQASWWGGRGVGTVPHGLIAAYGGDTVAAAVAFADRYHAEMNVTVLVDFENDSPATARPSRTRSATGCGACGWTRAGRSSTARCGTTWSEAPSPTDRPASTSGWSPGRARRSTRPGTSGCGSSSPAASPPSGSPSSSARASPSTPTASARRCCAATTTSPPTSCAPMGCRRRRSGGASGTPSRLTRVH